MMTANEMIVPKTNYFCRQFLPPLISYPNFLTCLHGAGELVRAQRIYRFDDDSHRRDLGMETIKSKLRLVSITLFDISTKRLLKVRRPTWLSAK